MRELRTDIQRARHGFQSVKIFGEAFPIPFQPFGQRNAGDVFHTFHQINQRLMMAFLHWRKANAAIAKKQSRHAMPGRRCELRVPSGLAIIMRMHIHPAGRDQPAFG